MIYHGSCHCGAARFEVEAPEKITAQDCNCSICSKSGFLHLIVPKSKFKLLSGEENLTNYTFNTGVAQHKFCKICGVKSFYIPRSNPDGIDVNVHCLDPQPKELIVEKFDGRNWEKNAAGLNHLSKDPKVEQAWIDEAERRNRELVEGEAKGVPGEKVFKKLRSRLRREV